MALTLDLTDAADDNDRKAIVDPLVAFNRTKAPDAHYRPLNVLLRDEDGNVMGGLWGRTDWGWFGIELLFVPETSRGRGMGADIVKTAEQEARARGCHGAWVNTFGWQALGFYHSLGYVQFGELPDFPTGYSRHFLQKRL